MVYSNSANPLLRGGQRLVAALSGLLGANPLAFSACLLVGRRLGHLVGAMGRKRLPGRWWKRIGHFVQDGIVIHHKRKARPVALTLGDDGMLIELAVAADEDLVEVPADHGQDLVQNLGGALGAGSIAGPIDGAERLIGFGQRGQEWVIGPLTIVGEVSPLFALAIDLFDGGIQINSCDLSARPRDLAPDFLSRPVDYRLEVLKVILVKASEEVAGGGGIGNPAGSEQMLDGIAVLEIGDVFDAMPADVLVIDMGEDVVRLAVGNVDLEQSDRPVDVPVEFQTHGQIVGQGHSTVGCDLAALPDFHTDLPVVKDRTDAIRPEQGLILVASDLFGFGALADAFGSGRIVHLKGLLATRWLLSQQPQYIAA